MKKHALYILLGTLLSIALIIPNALADSCCPSEKGTHIDQTSQVDGYQLEYQFIDMMEKMKNMEGMAHQMEGMTATHHLMLYIKDEQGEPVSADMAGFLITGPDGKDQKVMTMGMGGGNGADINLSQPGEYTIKAKALIGDKKLIDSFTYTVN